MSVKDATVTVKYEDLRAMEEQIATYKRDQEKFDEMLQEATLKGAHAADQFRTAFLTAFAIVQYSLGHLDAMTFRGFPYQWLAELSETDALTGTPSLRLRTYERSSSPARAG